jgi:hypothetical protein
MFITSCWSYCWLISLYTVGCAFLAVSNGSKLNYLIHQKEMIVATLLQESIDICIQNSTSLTDEKIRN